MIPKGKKFPKFSIKFPELVSIIIISIIMILASKNILHYFKFSIAHQ